MEEEEAEGGEDEQEEVEEESEEETPLLCHCSLDVYQITDRVFICKDHLEEVTPQKEKAEEEVN